MSREEVESVQKSQNAPQKRIHGASVRIAPDGIPIKKTKYDRQDPVWVGGGGIHLNVPSIIRIRNLNPQKFIEYLQSTGFSFFVR